MTVRYTLPGDGLGETDVVEAIHALEDRLEKAITDAGVGEFDGNELGGGEAVLFAYGPDATKLFAVMEPELRAFSPRPAYAILRFGAADDAAAVEKRIDL
ncbi:hypothetical protein SAMN05421812_13515 [Asanoa hainanensis]|uniref:Muconolactone delta-isomerase n=1 Tax=Asanoa hainanensis TaxID=560556 RepID=A0A239PI19_9ACTN|nr:hypothetical protein [Asanoa hainanensis]SNT66234.1 hypothetical protein SAMN05421812_13515 [Asanoa hainanensis]